MTEAKKKEIQDRLATKPQYSDQFVAKVGWYDEDVAVLMDEIRDIKALFVWGRVECMARVVRDARLLLDAFYRNQSQRALMPIINELDKSLQALDDYDKGEK